MVKYAQDRVYLLPRSTCQYLGPLQQRTSCQHLCLSSLRLQGPFSPEHILPMAGMERTPPLALSHSPSKSSETFAPRLG